MALYQSDPLNALNGVDRPMRRTERAGVFATLLVAGIVLGIVGAYAQSLRPGPSFAQTAPSPAPTHATPPPLPPQVR